jgi:hypothetical protein
MYSEYFEESFAQWHRCERSSCSGRERLPVHKELFWYTSPDHASIRAHTLIITTCPIYYDTFTGSNDEGDYNLRSSSATHRVTGNKAKGKFNACDLRSIVLSTNSACSHSTGPCPNRHEIKVEMHSGSCHLETVTKLMDN